MTMILVIELLSWITMVTTAIWLSLHEAPSYHGNTGNSVVSVRCVARWFWWFVGGNGGGGCDDNNGDGGSGVSVSSGGDDVVLLASHLWRKRWRVSSG